MREIFITGFPGFIASHYIPILLRQTKIHVIHLLVFPPDRLMAKIKLRKLQRQFPKVQFSIHEGDLRRPHLGIEILPGIESVHHLGAIYDLKIDPETAHSANLHGTRNLIEWMQKHPRIEQIIYFSTCYVIGKKAYLPEDFISQRDEASAFQNHYEHSKWRAEELFRQTKKTLIIRPSIVVGSRTTGRTEKYDGPYQVFRLLKRMGDSALLSPNLGSKTTHANLIPVDYLCEKTIEALLQHREDGAPLRIKNMADPNPLTTEALYAFAVRQITQKEPRKLPLLRDIVFPLISSRLATPFTKIHPTTFDYFRWEGKIETTLSDFPDIQKSLPAWIKDTPL